MSACCALGARAASIEESRMSAATTVADRVVIRHIEGRRSERVAWLLEELGVPYELDFIQGDIVGSLLALEAHHEMRMTPIVHIPGGGDDVVMVESGAILEYLLARFGAGSGLRPAEDSPAFPDYLQFLHFAEGTALAKIIQDVGERRLAKALADAGLPPANTPKLPGLAGSRSGAQRVMHFAENTLASRPYFAGAQFTAADIMMHFALKLGGPIAFGAAFDTKALLSGERDYLDDFPNVRAFMQRMAARPAFQRAMKRTMPNGPPPM
jgi:glutathione S-transferase